MSVIKIPILFVGSKGEVRLYSLFDSGANLSCINPDFLEKLEFDKPDDKPDDDDDPSGAGPSDKPKKPKKK